MTGSYYHTLFNRYPRYVQRDVTVPYPLWVFRVLYWYVHECLKNIKFVSPNSIWKTYTTDIHQVYSLNVLDTRVRYVQFISDESTCIDINITSIFDIIYCFNTFLPVLFQHLEVNFLKHDKLKHNVRENNTWRQHK